MLQRIRDQLGTAGLIVAVVALVAALAGGAFAANGGGEATASKRKVVKGPRGHKGAKGAVGAQGPQGSAGVNGKDGAAGAKGEKGDPGAAWAAGKSVMVSPIAAELPKCNEVGGAELRQEGVSTVEICNGEEGAEGDEGPEGQPWTPNNILPVGATETGSFGFSGAVAGEVVTAISFTVQLAQAPGPPQVHFLTEARQTAYSIPACTGNFAAPTALSCELCLYEGTLNNGSAPIIETLNFGGVGASKAGRTLTSTVGAGASYGAGSWAVTGSVVVKSTKGPGRQLSSGAQHQLRHPQHDREITE